MAKEKKVRKNAKQIRADRCLREIQAILERENCNLVISPVITVNGAPQQVVVGTRE